MSGILLAALAKPPDLVLSVSDSSPSGSDSDFAACGFVGTGTTTVSVVSGGTGSYTYSWAIVGSPATSGPFNPTNPTGATTAWSETVCDGDTTTETWRCTVTDTGNGKQATIDVSVSLNWSNLS